MTPSGRMDIPCKRTVLKAVYTCMQTDEKRHFCSAKNTILARRKMTFHSGENRHLKMVLTHCKQTMRVYQFLPRKGTIFRHLKYTIAMRLEELGDVRVISITEDAPEQLCVEGYGGPQGPPGWKGV